MNRDRQLARSVLLLPALLALVPSACATPASSRSGAPERTGDLGIELPYQARGQEPGWLLELTGSGMTLTWDHGRHTAHMPEPSVRGMQRGIRYSGVAGGHQVVARMTHALCHDVMSGIPYPDRVTVHIDQRRLRGCGGRPGALLKDTHWNITAIDGDDILHDSHPTIEFGHAGNFGGSGGCNSFSGSFELRGNRFKLGMVASTAVACDLPAIQTDGRVGPVDQQALAAGRQENRMIQLVSRMDAFNITDDGTLVLRTRSGTTMRARPAQSPR